jgi:hypothetical protein
MVQMLPPLKEHRLANQLEPRSELQRIIGEHGLELAFRDVFGVLDLVGTGLEVNVGFDEEDVVDWSDVSFDIASHA